MKVRAPKSPNTWILENTSAAPTPALAPEAFRPPSQSIISEFTTSGGLLRVAGFRIFHAVPHARKCSTAPQRHDYAGRPKTAGSEVTQTFRDTDVQKFPSFRGMTSHPALPGMEYLQKRYVVTTECKLTRLCFTNTHTSARAHVHKHAHTCSRARTRRRMYLFALLHSQTSPHAQGWHDAFATIETAPHTPVQESPHCDRQAVPKPPVTRLHGTRD